jgi:hypothetical protein
MVNESETVSFEYAVLSPLVILYSSNKNVDVQMGALKILLHVLEVLIFLYMLFTAGIRQYLLTCIVSETWRKVVI